MDSPQRQERREFRYPLHLPVLVRMPHRKEMRTRSENISLGGILLSSAFVIPEGSIVDVTVGVEHLPDPGILLSAHGKVLRVQPKITDDFAVAIQLDRAFKLPSSGLKPLSTAAGAKPISPRSRPNTALRLPRPQLASVWDTET